MKRLIIGAGHVGRELIARWVRAGEPPVATARSPRRAAELAALGATPLEVDVLAPATLDALPEVDVAVWCVGHDRAAGPGIREVYVQGLANALARLRCARLVYTSSTGVYGATAGDEVDETSPTQPEDAGGTATLEAEQLLRAQRPDAIVLRLAGLYGGDRVIGRRQVEQRTPLTGDPERWLNLVHHEDAAAAVDLAARQAAPGALYDVADGHPLSRRAYYEALAHALGAPPPTFTGSGPRGAGRRVMARRIRAELGFAPRWPSFSAALPALIGA